MSTKLSGHHNEVLCCLCWMASKALVLRMARPGRGPARPQNLSFCHIRRTRLWSTKQPAGIIKLLYRCHEAS